MESWLRISSEITKIGPDTLFKVGGFPVTNSLLAILMIVVGFVILSLWIGNTFKIKPRRPQLLVEFIYEKMYDLIGQITGHPYYAKKVFPLIASLFVYLAVANLFGVVPGLTSFTYQGLPIFRTPTTDFNTTFGLAVAMVLFTQAISLQNWGLVGYLGKFFQFKEIYLGFKQGVSEGSVAIIGFFVGLLDIVSEFAKVISLSLRLFGNIYAGEVLAIVFMSALAYGLPAVLLASGLFFGLIQAMVFGSLVAAYYMSMVNPALAESEPES